MHRRWLIVGFAFVSITALVSGLAVAAKSGKESKDEAEPTKVQQPSDLRTQLQKQVDADNTPERLLDHLAGAYNLDDLANASGHLPIYLHPESYHYECEVIPNLARVRRLIQECDGNARKKLRPKLEKMLSESMHDFQRAYDECRREDFKIYYDTAPAFPPKRMEYERRTLAASVATYLLAEFRSFDSLPRLAEAFENPSRRHPVSRLLVFYAMHILALEYPLAKLGPDAAAALKDYIAATQNVVPKPEMVSRVGWKAATDEQDLRVIVLRKKLPIEELPQVRLHVLPHSLAKLEDDQAIVVKADRGLSPEVDQWYAKLKKFVELAYPRASNK